MIVKILGSAGSDFHGVKYNDKKVEKGTGELMLMKNFPSFINENSSQSEVRDYFKSVSKNEKVKNPQFHTVISTKFQNHSKEELTKIAEDFMTEMSYGNQPFIIVFHNDTENNHVHIVSTRVDKNSGKKINDSFEKLKSQKALSNVLEKLYGINNEEKINQLLNYKFSSLKQLELLLERNGFRLSPNKNDENALDILKNGVREKTVYGNQLVFDNRKNENRTKQIKAILLKYKNLCSNKVFKVEDRRKQAGMLPEEKQKDDWKPKIEFESELQKKLRDTFGIDIIFHQAYEKHQTKEKLEGGLRPFGYTLIDNKSEKIYKGSEIMKMNELFEFTAGTIDKKRFESLKNQSIPNQETEHKKENNGFGEIFDDLLFELSKSSGTAKDPAENELKKRRKRR